MVKTTKITKYTVHTRVPWLHSSHVILDWLLWELTAELVSRPSGEPRARTWPFILSWFNRQQTHTKHCDRGQLVQTWNGWSWTLFCAIFSHHVWTPIFGQSLWSRVWLCMFQMCPRGEDFRNMGWGKLNWLVWARFTLKVDSVHLLMPESTVWLEIVSWPESQNSPSSKAETAQYGYSIVWRICLHVQMKHLAPLTTSLKLGFYM